VSYTSGWSPDVRAVAEAVVDVLEERGLVVSALEQPARVLDAVQVGRLIGRDRRWVYAHAEELGGFRYGKGPRARLGFDLAVIERWKRDQQISTVKAQQPRRGRPPKRLAAAGLIPFEA
jgi:hypothetical protein